MQAQLDRLEEDDADGVAARQLVGRLREVDDPGLAVRIHGDYHLGQVLRTDSGWFVLDFEGEPARPLAERQMRSSPLQDVAGMLRSFRYAAAVALAERDERDHAELAPLAESWGERNRKAFLDGYLSAEGVQALLPAGAAQDTILAAFELDKAVYEVLYEQAYRPDWVHIPRQAVRRLLHG
jgi:maltokinase